MLYEVHVSPQPIERFGSLIPQGTYDSLRDAAADMRERMRGRVLWNVNSTSSGGGVAEMLRPLIGYARGVGLDARWIVMQGSPEFFHFTKKLHNALHGVACGSGFPSAEEAGLYEQISFENAVELATAVRRDDIVLLHDPQTAGLIPHLARLGAKVVWRCHVGSEDFGKNAVHASWAFLLPHLEHAASIVFTRRAFVPPELTHLPLQIIPPSIDPFSAKNQELPPESVRAILLQTGLLEGAGAIHEARFVREDGTPGRVDRAADVMRLGRATDPDVPLIVQVSRWDRLKDPIGVLRGFTGSPALTARNEAELILAGPNVHAVSDDPEGAEVFAEVLEAWRQLPHHQRHRVHLASLPMADVEENAAIVNALQTHAAIVVQKSLHEGFGLTVTEAMWKRKAVVASRVGGISDQLEDHVHGLLLDDAEDLEAFAAALRELLDDPGLGRRLGEKARARVMARYLSVHSLVSYTALIRHVDGEADLQPHQVEGANVP